MWVTASIHFNPEERRALLGAIEHALEECMRLDPFDGRADLREALGRNRRRIVTAREPFEGRGSDWSVRSIRECLGYFVLLEREHEIELDEYVMDTLTDALRTVKKVELLGEDWAED